MAFPFESLDLSSQHLPHAPPQVKTHTAFLGLALVDALGAPGEFKPRYNFSRSKQPILEMLRNSTFGTAPGVWTDDTSMALCLAKSLVEKQGSFDQGDQLDKYYRWYDEGYMSCVDNCFDIGNSVRKALSIWAQYGKSSQTKGLQQIKQQLNSSSYRGNGSLMRVLPISLAFHGLGEAQAVTYAELSSVTTHPDKMCVEACQLYTRLITRILHKGASQEVYTKLDVLKALSSDDFTQSLTTELADHLTLRAHQGADADQLPEETYVSLHPLFRNLALVPHSKQPKDSPSSHPALDLLPTHASLSSSGYVLHTLVAALYAFFATTTFEDGAVLVANMGDDADTVGAVYGGLAGTWYGLSSSATSTGEDDLFWSPRVRQWAEALKRREVIEGTAKELAALAEHVRPGQA